MGNFAYCRTCRRRVFWVDMASGKKNPLDPDPLTIADDKPEESLIQIDDQGIGHVAKGRKGYRSHFVTCAQASQHRRPRQRRDQMEFGG